VTSEANQPRATRTKAGPRGLAPGISEQLGKLTAMHRRGDLTDAEFAAAKKRLLDT
jgi:Short C-terminal domain